MRPPTVGAIGRELSSTSTAHNWVRDGGWPRGWPPWESQAWEADTLPAELLPLGATGVIADRARGANGNPAASALRSLEWLRRYGTLAPHRPGAEPQLASVDIDPVALNWPLTGSYSSAESTAAGGIPSPPHSTPPAIRALPLGSNVAVCSLRPVVIDPVVLNWSLTGSYSSAEDGVSELPNPPAIRTFPSASNVAAC